MRLIKFRRTRRTAPPLPPPAGSQFAATTGAGRRWRCELRLGGVCIGAASECDHVVAVADGGGHELSNLRAACSPCHKATTAQQGGGFRRGGGTREDPACQPRTAR